MMQADGPRHCKFGKHYYQNSDNWHPWVPLVGEMKCINCWCDVSTDQSWCHPIELMTPDVSLPTISSSPLLPPSSFLLLLFLLLHATFFGEECKVFWCDLGFCFLLFLLLFLSYLLYLCVFSFSLAWSDQVPEEALSCSDISNLLQHHPQRGLLLFRVRW